MGDSKDLLRFDWASQNPSQCVTVTSCTQKYCYYHCDQLGTPQDDVLHLIGRKICLKRRNMPKWNQHIEQKNKVDPNDNFNFNVFGMKKR